jgi:hypothetical protein
MSVCTYAKSVVTGMEGGVETVTRASSPPVEIVPMKLETPEYVEDEGVSGEDTAEDTLARLRENDELLLTKSSDVKLEQHSFGTRSDTHAMDMLHTTDKGQCCTLRLQMPLYI